MGGINLKLSNVNVYGGLRALAISNTDAPDLSTLVGTEQSTVNLESTELSFIGFTGTFSGAAVLFLKQTSCTFIKCRFFALTPIVEYGGIGVNTKGGNASFFDCLLNNASGNEALILNADETGILKFKNCTFASSQYNGINDITSYNLGAQTIRFDGINNNGVTPKINNMDIACGIEVEAGRTYQTCTEF
jgi:hypothetical protein